MRIFNKKANSGLMNEIRCDEPSYLIWKWRPGGSSLDNNRENAIRWGSSLRVKDGSVAVFVYTQIDGTVQEYIEGPCDKIVNTNNFPILASIVGMAYGGGTPFQAEIYFINLAGIIHIKFAVPFFHVFDPRFLDFSVPIAVRGSISFKINDYKEFIKLHRLDNFDLNDFQNQIKDAISRYVKNIVANAPSEHKIPVLQIENKIMQINEMVELDLKIRLRDDFGVAVSGIDISSIEIDKSSDAYRQLEIVTQNIDIATIQAQTGVKINEMRDKQRIEAVNYEEILRTQREESQYAQRKQTQTANFAVYQIEAQKDIGVEGAKALGNMGANDTGGITNGNFNPTTMIAGMAIGGTIGQNIAGTMNNAMAGINIPIQSGIAPPPIPASMYHIVVNGKIIGPFDISILSQMALSGNIMQKNLVWKTGMNDWMQADSIDELKQIFNTLSPVFPS